METLKKIEVPAEGGALGVKWVRDQVRRMIHCGDLQPGERINEQALALQLQVGRATAREALRSLESAGLIRIIPNKGAEVCKLSLEDTLHLYDIRAGLARTTGRLVASRLTVEEETEIMKTLGQMERAASGRDAATYQHWNDVFHHVLMEATKNPRLISVNRAVEDELKLYLSKGVFTLAQIRVSLAEHREMLEAVISGQPERAAESFEKHVLTGKQRMLDTLGGEVHEGGHSKLRKGQHV